MFWMMLYDIFDVNTDYQNEKVPTDTNPLTNLVFYLTNSRQYSYTPFVLATAISELNGM